MEKKYEFNIQHQFVGSVTVEIVNVLVPYDDLVSAVRVTAFDRCTNILHVGEIDKRIKSCQVLFADVVDNSIHVIINTTTGLYDCIIDGKGAIIFFRLKMITDMCVNSIYDSKVDTIPPHPASIDNLIILAYDDSGNEVVGTFGDFIDNPIQ